MWEENELSSRRKLINMMSKSQSGLGVPHEEDNLISRRKKYL
jgi:hypothetical protein